MSLIFTHRIHISLSISLYRQQQYFVFLEMRYKLSMEKQHIKEKVSITTHLISRRLLLFPDNKPPHLNINFSNFMSQFSNRLHTLSLFYSGHHCLFLALQAEKKSVHVYSAQKNLQQITSFTAARPSKDSNFGAK